MLSILGNNHLRKLQMEKLFLVQQVSNLEHKAR